MAAKTGNQEHSKANSLVSRRKFLKGLGVTAAAVATVGSTAALTPAARAARKKKTARYGMVIDLKKCFGCHACSVACKAQFDVPLGFWRSWVVTTERGKYPNVKRSFLPVLCNQCDNPPCVTVCPTGATYKRSDGIVAQREDNCIGCKYCVQACPYKAKFSHPTKKVAQKCDFCIERVEQGLMPSCVNTCNAKARVFGDLNDPDSEISRVIRENPVQALRTEFGTEPRVFYIGLNQGDYQPTCNLCALGSVAHEHA